MNVKTLTLEDCKFKLPMLSQHAPAMESIFNEDEGTVLSSSIGKIETFEKLGAAVGKVIEVRFNTRKEESRDAQEVVIPVVVKLDNMVMPSEVLNTIMTSNSDEITLGSRFKDAIAGRINFIKDFLLCSDLIKAQKKTMIKDPTGYYTQLLKRINNSRMFSALSGNISVAGISSILVISEEDEREIQKLIGGKLSNQKTREIIFNNTSAMCIVVVNREWEKAEIFIKDIDGFAQNSFSDFKAMSKADTNNIGDILKAFSVSSMPSF